MSTETTVTGNTDSTWTDVTSSSSSTTSVELTAPELAVAVDQADADYAPGETVGITATNVAIGATVTFDVEHVLADGTVAGDLTGTGTPWTITDGGTGDLDGVANGAIQTSWYVNADALNQGFLLSATDTGTGETAIATFTDAGALGVLQAPTGASPTGDVYNSQKWSVLDGDAITGTITGATDAFVYDGNTVDVQIQSSEHGNTIVHGTYLNGTITFTWTVQSPDGTDICDTLVVAYATHHTNGKDVNDRFELVNSSGPSGFGVVNPDGTHHDDQNGDAPGCGDDT